MTQRDWAKNEIKLACKNANPNWDEMSFDYDCSCYVSALKAFNSMIEDNHSGFSWKITLSILDRLCNSLPLLPIEDSDFFQVNKSNEEEISNENDFEDSEIGKQCPRMASLFRIETPDGKIKYKDVERTFFKDVKSGTTFQSSIASRLVDEMFPIKMPYFPNKNKYIVNGREYLCDKRNGDFDTIEILSVTTPDNKEIKVNKYLTWKDDKFVEIKKHEFKNLLTKNFLN